MSAAYPHTCFTDEGCSQRRHQRQRRCRRRKVAIIPHAE